MRPGACADLFPVSRKQKCTFARPRRAPLSPNYYRALKRLLIQLVKFLFFLGLGVGILYLVYRGQNRAYQEDCALKGIPAADCSLLDKVIADFGQVNYAWILLVLTAFTLSNVSRAIRWNMLLKSMGYTPRLSNGFLTIVLGYFANLGLPRLGEVVRAGTMARYENMPVEKVMGTIVVDRVVDVISILLVSALAFFLQYDAIWAFLDQQVDLGDRFGGLANLFWALVLSGLLVLGAFFLFRRRLEGFALYQKVVNIGRGFLEGLQTIGKLDKPWLFVLHSINIWFMYFLMTYLCFFAFAPTAHLGPVAALLVFVFGGWGIVIPSPGGMGTYHFLAQTALSIYGISGDDAFSWANIAFFSIQLGNNILLGLLALLILPLRNRNYHPQQIQYEQAA